MNKKKTRFKIRILIQMKKQKEKCVNNIPHIVVNPLNIVVCLLTGSFATFSTYEMRRKSFEFRRLSDFPSCV